MNNSTPKYEYMQINSKQIIVDTAYQRILDPERVKKIVSNFNPYTVNAIKVSSRDGKYYVFDGQHTVASLKLRNNNYDLMVECKVYYGLTQADEARQFSEQTGIARGVLTNAKMKSLIVAGDIEIIDLNNIVESVGFHLSFSNSGGNNRIVACGTLFRIYKKVSQAELVYILTTIKNSWNGAGGSLNKEILEGMYLFFKAYKNEIDIRRAISQFSRISPIVIIREARAFHEGGNTRYARQLLNAYNKNLSKYRLKDIL